MEDNEFEEVTIISHTDLCSSVLPQATAERLMKEIRLEVTQKISPTENVKLGTLHDPEAERRLNRIQEVLQSPGFLADQDLHMYHNGLVAEDAFYLVGSEQNYATQFGLKDEHTETGCPECYFAAEIGPFVLFFFHSLPVNVYNTATKEWSRLKHPSNVDIGEEPAVARRGVYFKSKIGDVFRMVCISIDESGQLVDECCEEPETMSLVCADRVSGSVLVLDQKGTLWKDNYDLELLEIVGEECVATCLKQMYSDHFLVGVQNSPLDGVILLDHKTLKKITSLYFDTGFRTAISFNLRMLAPRFVGCSVFNYVLALNGEEVYLICEYQQKLYHITNCQFSKMVYGLSHFHNNYWLLVGKRPVVVQSLIVEFPKALRVC